MDSKTSSREARYHNRVPLCLYAKLFLSFVPTPPTSPEASFALKSKYAAHLQNPIILSFRMALLCYTSH